MPGLAGSDGSLLVAWPFVLKFLLLPRRPPAVHGLRCHHPPPRAPLETTAGIPLWHRVPPPRSIIADTLDEALVVSRPHLLSSLSFFPLQSPLCIYLSLFVIADFLQHFSR